MEDHEIIKKLKGDYKVRELQEKDVAKNELCSFLGVKKSEIKVNDAYPTDKGIVVYLSVGTLNFKYYSENKSFELSLDGNLYPLKEKADVGRILILKEDKND